MDILFLFLYKSLLGFVVNNTDNGRKYVNGKGHGINKYYKSTHRKKSKADGIKAARGIYRA